MKQRRVHVPAVLDWHSMGQTRLMEGIEPYLDKAFNSIHGLFVCMGWRRFFEIQKVVYKKLVIELLATVSFARNEGIVVEDNLSFALVEKGKPFSTLLYKRENVIVDHGMGGFSIPDDTPRGRVPRRVRQRRDPNEDAPPVVPTDDKLPMDPYSISSRRFEDNLARTANYTNMSIVYPYTPSWEKLWKEQQGGVGSGGGGGDDGDDEE
ncbi:unnamed protein product [Lactuca saligna]|uniref:Uncharacterized protein n=1 Tax=Lactuca saligna TaxID=75948 RepID=A0AA35YNE3_LACSI|nr:unnamed protein product [Lactuca saligna]